MNNILDLVMRRISSTATGDIAKLLGLSTDKTGRALQSGLATILGAMAVGAAKPGAAENLLKHLTAGGFDTDMFRDLDELFVGNQATDDFIEAGGNLVASLYGGKQNDVLDTLGPFVGLGRDEAQKLLSLVTPLVLSNLGGLVRKDRLNAAMVADLLMGQKAFVSKFLPGGMMDLIGLDDLGDVDEIAEAAVAGKATTRSAATVATASSAESHETEGGHRIWPWILVFVLAAIAAAVYFSRDLLPTTEPVETTAVSQVAAPGGVTIELPGGALLRVSEESFNAAFARYLGSDGPDSARVFAIDIVEFATGSSRLTPVSRAHVEDFRKILSAYPTVTIKLIGHADAVGSANENLALSVRRAEAARDVLIRAGIETERISVEGRGSTEPIAPNDTEEGRARNRRIELMVTGW